MGADSLAKTVVNTNSKYEPIYKITNKRGISYTVNEDHILTLKFSGSKGFDERKDRKSYRIIWYDNKKFKIVSCSFSYNISRISDIDTKEYPNITPEDYKILIKKRVDNYLDNIVEDRIADIPLQNYIKFDEIYREKSHGFQSIISFPEKDIPIDPYMIGFWLGDGDTATCAITNQDSTVLHYLRHNLGKYNCYLQSQKSIYRYRINACNNKDSGRENFFLNSLRQLDLIHNKHIPLIYKCNSRENRLKLLAGLLDADGSFDGFEFEFSQGTVHTKLMDDVIYLVQSLGFSATKHIKNTTWSHKEIKNNGLADRIHINGHGIEEIPTLIPRKRAKPRDTDRDAKVSQIIRIESLGNCVNYSMELNEPSRYVMGNFITTYN
jgi:hypothetical protein